MFIKGWMGIFDIWWQTEKKHLIHENGGHLVPPSIKKGHELTILKKVNTPCSMYISFMHSICKIVHVHTF